MAIPQLVAVVGAGNMGAGIAQKIAMEGFDVLLADLDLARAEAGRGRVAASLDEAVERRVLDRARADAVLARVKPVGGLDGLADADLVIEAIFEDLLAKKDLFRRLDDVCKKGCVLATNTSSFYVHELAAVTRRPGDVVGLHYFYHPAKNRLLEVVPGPLTRPQVVADMDRFAEAHGKTVLHTTDSPGFAVNRFFVPWLNEAVRLLEEGVADIASIEAAARSAFGIPMGPFELMNVTGVAIAMHTAHTLGTELGAFYEPAEALVRQGSSGDLWPLGGQVDEAVAGVVGDRLLGTVFAIAGALVDEGVCSKEDVDRGARVGLRWRRGPFELMNRTGLPRVAELCGQLHDRHPDFAVPDCIAEQATTGEPWPFRRVELSVQDGIARVTINRPEVMGALDEEVVDQLAARFEEALATPGLRGVVLASAGKAFVAGADISFFVRNIKGGDIDRIERFTRRGQELLRRIEEAPVPVVARVHGMALGGGVEVALACHAIVNSDRTSFTLPETGLGIYPGLGGTQRLPRIVGRPLARRLILTGRRLSASDAVKAGLALETVPLTRLDEAIEAWLERGLPPRYGTIPAGDPVVDELWGDPDHVAALLAGSVPDGLSEAAAAMAAKDLRALARKGPIALREANRLIDEGAVLPLADGLELELDALAAIFSTSDALLGLRSVGKREAPECTGS